MSQEQEPNEFPLPAELAALEQRLAAFTPAAVRVDRDRLMFAAGRVAAVVGGSPSVVRPQPHTAWYWPAATVLMTAASILLAVMLVRQTEWRPMTAKPAASHLVGTSDNTVKPAAGSDSIQFDQLAADRGSWPWSARPTSGYLALRYVALTQGVGAIGGRPAAANGVPDEPTPPPTARELMEELLPAAVHASS
jgi:hypothetical protein